MTCCLVLSVDLATDFSATFGPSMFGRFAIVIREFASASMWLFLVCMPCRVLQSTSTNLLCYVRPWFVLLTDSDVRHENISMNEELWVDHHKMIGTLAPFFRSFVIFIWSWLWSACTGTDSTGGRAHSHGLLGRAERLIRTVSCGRTVCMTEWRMICTITWPRSGV